MSHWSDEYTQLIEDCERREGRLSDWERGFLDSLSRQIAEGRMPTRNQIEKLDEVWDRVTARG